MPSLPELIPQEEGDEDDDSDDEIRVGNIIKDYKCPITTILLVDPVTKWVCELKDYSPEEIKNRKREKDQKSFWESCSLRHATPPSKPRSRKLILVSLFLSHLSTIPPPPTWLFQLLFSLPPSAVRIANIPIRKRPSLTWSIQRKRDVQCLVAWKKSRNPPSRRTSRWTSRSNNTREEWRQRKKVGELPRTLVLPSLIEGR